MNTYLHLLESEGALSRWREIIAREVEGVTGTIARRVPEHFHRHAIDIVVEASPEDTIPGLGIGGCCFRRGKVTISLDPSIPDFADLLAGGAFARTLAHELHHAMRWNMGGYGTTLGEAIVSEGLADVFAASVTGAAPAPWTIPAAATDWPALLREARSVLDRADYDHPAWFFGTADLPRWAGYAIGYRLARAYGDANPDALRDGMVDVPALTVLTFWDAIAA